MNSRDWLLCATGEVWRLGAKTARPNREATVMDVEGGVISSRDIKIAREVAESAMSDRDFLRLANRIIDEVRTTGKPYIIEAMTYRFAGHGAADNDRSLYRDSKEEEEHAKRDPIKLYEAYLIANKIMTKEKMEAIEAEQIEEVEKIYDEADAQPFPDPEEVYNNVYSDMMPEVGH